MGIFRLQSSYQPAGDQPQAIADLIAGLERGDRNQVLLGVTGSGKTFTMANVIQAMERPTLILAPNKTLAAQLYEEMREFFPENAVEYFVSYYDYYQPEAYVPRTDLYIEKESSINEQIDRMRHSATRALLERRDVVIVASVSCIYGIGAVENYSHMTLAVAVGQEIAREAFLTQLIALQYRRNDMNFQRGAFRAKGDTVDVFPAHYEDRAWRFSFFGDEIESIEEIDPLTGEKCAALDEVKIFSNSHHAIPHPTLVQARHGIENELAARLETFRAENKLVEAQRLEQRVRFDLEMLAATGICNGIENYSRYMTGRDLGDPPPTLFEYLPKDALFIVDESHVAIPQLQGMYRGDRSRKETLSEHGFRLPSCKDNRPLKFEEWDALRPQTIFVSATPSTWEMEQAHGIFADQVIRPTGLIDPVCIVRPTRNQIDDLIHECLQCVSKNQRILVTTLTKQMAEALTDFLAEAGLKTQYVHSDVDTISRIEIIRDLRLGIYDVLIGINLLREGLDIPECGLVAILDADKEGFLRSQTALIQTIGRAARNVEGRAILYADTITRSMKAAMDETNRRREKQQQYNALHNITARSVSKTIKAAMTHAPEAPEEPALTGAALQKELASLEKQMHTAASDLDFEQAVTLRDKIQDLKDRELGLQARHRPSRAPTRRSRRR